MILQETQKERTIFWEHLRNRAIRKGDWKLVSVADGNWELYNLKTDRTESNNLIDSKSDIAEELKSEYNIWAEKVGVKF